MSNWKLVKDELPEMNRQVLLLTDKRYWSAPGEMHVTATGYLSKIGEKYWAIFGEQGQQLSFFTHWMYVPPIEEDVKDVIEKFSVEELQDIVETTESFSCFSVEHIFHTALYGPSQKHCDWGHEDDYGIHETSCGHTFEFTTDGVKENDFKYCPYCGKLISVATL